MTAAAATEVVTAARPFLKWAGGKTKLLPEIMKRLPEKIGAYYEPFLGGGAVFFELVAAGRIGKAFLSESNAELIRTYSGVSASTEAVVRRLWEHARNHNEKHFYEIRSLPPEDMNDSVVAARMIYLNRTCFNGLYRVNRAGKFNVPFGAYKNPMICDADNLRAVSRALRDHADLICCDFEAAISSAKRGEVAYFDPPYMPISKTSNFTAYGKMGFGPEEHERLRNVAEKLSARGVHVLISNSDCEFIRELYDGFLIEKVSAPRRINCKGGKRGDVRELLISGKKA